MCKKEKPGTTSSPSSSKLEEKILEVIISMDKMIVMKLWREECMLMTPVVEQHHMVLFHDRWIQRKFKEENGRFYARDVKVVKTNLTSDTLKSSVKCVFEMHLKRRR